MAINQIQLLEPLGEWWTDPGIFLLRKIFNVNSSLSIDEFIAKLQIRENKDRIITGILSIPFSAKEFLKYMANGMMTQATTGTSSYDPLEKKKSLKNQFIEEIFIGKKKIFKKTTSSKKKDEKDVKKKKLTSMDKFQQNYPTSFEILSNFFDISQNKANSTNDEKNTIKQNNRDLNKCIKDIFEEYEVSKKESKLILKTEQILSEEFHLDKNNPEYENYKNIIRMTDSFKNKIENWKDTSLDNDIQLIFEKFPPLNEIFESWKQLKIWNLKDEANIGGTLKTKLEKFYDETIEELCNNSSKSISNTSICWICSKILTDTQNITRAKYPFLGAKPQPNFFPIQKEGQNICNLCQFLAILSFFSFFTISIKNMPLLDTKKHSSFYISMISSNYEINNAMAKISLDRFNSIETGMNLYLGNGYQSIFKIIDQITNDNITINISNPNMSFIIFLCQNEPTKVSFKEIHFPNPSYRFIAKLKQFGLLKKFYKEILTRNLSGKKKTIITKHIGNSYQEKNFVYSIKNKMFDALLNGEIFKIFRYMVNEDKKIIDTNIFQIYLVEGLKMRTNQIKEIKDFANGLGDLIKIEKNSKGKQRQIFKFLKNPRAFGDFLRSLSYFKQRAIINNIEPIKSINIDNILTRLCTPEASGIPKDWRIVASLIEIQTIDAVSDIYKDLFSSEKNGDNSSEDEQDENEIEESDDEIEDEIEEV